jgi:hypothetical protein
MTVLNRYMSTKHIQSKDIIDIYRTLKKAIHKHDSLTKAVALACSKYKKGDKMNLIYSLSGFLLLKSKICKKSVNLTFSDQESFLATSVINHINSNSFSIANLEISLPPFPFINSMVLSSLVILSLKTVNLQPNHLILIRNIFKKPNKLEQLSIDDSMKYASQNSFYSLIKAICEESNIFIVKFSNMEAFLEKYLMSFCISEKIQKIELFNNTINSETQILFFNNCNNNKNFTLKNRNGITYSIERGFKFVNIPKRDFEMLKDTFHPRPAEFQNLLTRYFSQHFSQFDYDAIKIDFSVVGYILTFFKKIVQKKIQFCALEITNSNPNSEILSNTAPELVNIFKGIEVNQIRAYIDNFPLVDIFNFILAMVENTVVKSLFLYSRNSINEKQESILEKIIDCEKINSLSLNCKINNSEFMKLVGKLSYSQTLVNFSCTDLNEEKIEFFNLVTNGKIKII